MVDARGNDPRFLDFQSSTLTVNVKRPYLVDKERIELSSPGCKPSILPLNDSPTTGVIDGTRTRVNESHNLAPIHLGHDHTWSRLRVLTPPHAIYKTALLYGDKPANWS